MVWKSEQRHCSFSSKHQVIQPDNARNISHFMASFEDIMPAVLFFLDVKNLE